MAINVATLVAQLKMDTRDFQAGASRASRETDQLERSMGRGSRAVDGMRTAMRLAAAAGAVQLGKELFNAGVQAQAFERRFNTVFEGVTDEMAAWVDEQNELFGVSESRLQGMAAAVGDLLVPLGMTRQAAARTSREVLTLANALSEWTGGQRGAEEVVQILTRAMLGEREALIGLGVKISEADVQARVAAAGMAHLTGEALQQARAMETLQLIQERSTDALTAYEEGGSDALRAQKELSAAIGDLKDAFGELIVEAAPLIELLAGISTGIASAFRPDTGRVIQEMAEGMYKAASPVRDFSKTVDAAKGKWLDFLTSLGILVPTPVLPTVGGPTLPDIPSGRGGFGFDGEPERTGFSGGRRPGIDFGGGGVVINVAGSVVTERDLATTVRQELINLSISGS